MFEELGELLPMSPVKNLAVAFLFMKGVCSTVPVLEEPRVGWNNHLLLCSRQEIAHSLLSPFWVEFQLSSLWMGSKSKEGSALLQSCFFYVARLNKVSSEIAFGLMSRVTKHCCPKEGSRSMTLVVGIPDEEFLLPPGGLKAGREERFQAAQPCFLVVIAIIIIIIHLNVYHRGTQENYFGFLNIFAGKFPICSALSLACFHMKKSFVSWLAHLYSVPGPVSLHWLGLHLLASTGTWLSCGAGSVRLQIRFVKNLIFRFF